MKRTLYCSVCIFLLLAPCAAKNSPARNNASLLRTTMVHPTVMHATGKVLQVSAAFVKIERLVKGKKEIMEFVLNKPAAHIGVSDYVKIDYKEENGKLMILRLKKVNIVKK